MFEFFLAAAKEQEKTVTPHTKGAEKEVLELLDRYDVSRAIVHWYSEPLDIFRELVARGLHFTIGIEMDYELELTKANRLRVARAFCLNKRVDFSIECAIEGQLGRVFVDNLAQPTAFCIRVGPFGYFAGDARSAGGRQLVQRFPAYHLLMPSPVAWVELAHEIYGKQLKPLPRHSLSATQLSPDHLAQLLERAPFRERIIPLGLDLARQATEQPEGYLDLSDFDSVADFVERGMGYTILDEGKMMGIAYSSLVCSQGIEVSLYVEEAYRRQGVATALGCALLLECLKYSLRPNWDAANLQSVRLAEKLGYLYLEPYTAYYHTRE